MTQHKLYNPGNRVCPDCRATKADVAVLEIERP